jgi:hypothetical protein
MLAKVPRVGHTFLMNEEAKKVMRAFLALSDAQRAEFDTMLEGYEHWMQWVNYLPATHPSRPARVEEALGEIRAKYDL